MDVITSDNPSVPLPQFVDLTAVVATVTGEEKEKEEEEEEEGASTLVVGATPPLPAELLQKIVMYLSSPRDLARAAAVCSVWREVVQDPYMWKQRAIEKWGADVIQSINPPHSWHDFYIKRVGRVWQPLKKRLRSPLDLSQERFCHDPWRMLATIMIFSRTSGGPTIRAVIHAFFKLCPTPAALLSTDRNAIMDIVKPCGLNAARTKALYAFTGAWLTTDWKQPIELFGIGHLGNASYHIFCFEKWETTHTTDKSLKAYIEWKKRVKNGTLTEQEQHQNALLQQLLADEEDQEEEENEAENEKLLLLLNNNNNKRKRSLSTSPEKRKEFPQTKKARCSRSEANEKKKQKEAKEKAHKKAKKHKEEEQEEKPSRAMKPRLRESVDASSNYTTATTTTTTTTTDTTATPPPTPRGPMLRRSLSSRRLFPRSESLPKLLSVPTPASPESVSQKKSLPLATTTTATTATTATTTKKRRLPLLEEESSHNTKGKKHKRVLVVGKNKHDTSNTIQHAAANKRHKKQKDDDVHSSCVLRRSTRTTKSQKH
eukprot:TRINITY_DN2465_c0_g1_i3.p1 TRINITY_DN2465_c0_g1~~TRINITY_DN2465_c0_g1_i3.p1  ORF type:complete len:552 (-),score=175.54 TRINITY_DN2465_c0_g1_i3:16-1644(-)